MGTCLVIVGELPDVAGLTPGTDRRRLALPAANDVSSNPQGSFGLLTRLLTPNS
jgi:hypothetical protein